MASITDKGTQIMDGLLLRQYHESPNLIQYLHAYVEEMDELFYAIEDVYFGRLLETAIGAQLDVIGVILQQSRNIDIETVNFGFLGVTLVDGFGDTGDESKGGLFKSGDSAGATVAPLNDEAYKRVLLCKSNILNKDEMSIETIYESLNTLLNRVPKHMVVTEPANLQVDIELLDTDIRDDEYLLILYMSKYFIPAGITLTITLIV